ncbi:MAG TPA: hypothetical protein DCS87_11580 [Rheinheimera sp.]|nr:hypothetical protein [Rheinheimera sp.]
MVIIPAFRGRDNVEKLSLSDENGLVDFAAAGITSIKLRSGTSEIACTAGVGGVVTFQPGDLDLTSGYHPAQLILFSGAKPDGEVVAGPGLPANIQIQMFV